MYSTINIGIALGLIALLAGLAAIGTVPRLRTRLLGTSSLAHGTLPLIAAGLTWIATELSDVYKDRLSDSSAPDDATFAFIEEVRFGLPTIPATYKERELSGHDLQLLFAPFRKSKEAIRLTQQEVQRINAIAEVSGQVESISSERSYQLKELADNFSPVVGFYHEYGQWENVCAEWSNALKSSADMPAADRNQRRTNEVWRFVRNNIRPVLNAPGLFQGIIGMASRGQLSLDPVQGDCLDVPLPGISHGIEESSYQIEFDTFSVTLAGKDTRSGRKDLGAALLRRRLSA
jgi:hypothetical protein